MKRMIEENLNGNIRKVKVVLLVEDEADVVENLSRFIERKGYKVVKAKDGTEGVALYRENKPDCVFLDMHLPKMDGMAVLREIKEMDSQARVYFMTGDEREEIRKEAEEIGVAGFALKPISISEIMDILGKI